MRKSIVAITGTVAGTALLTALKLGIAPVGSTTTVTSEPPAAGGAPANVAPADPAPAAPPCPATFRNAAGRAIPAAPVNWRGEDGDDDERRADDDERTGTGAGSDDERTGTGAGSDDQRSRATDDERSRATDDGRAGGPEAGERDGDGDDDGRRGGGQGPGTPGDGTGGTSTGPAAPSCPAPSTPPPCSCASPSAPAPSAPATPPAPSKPGTPPAPSKPGTGLRDGTFKGAASTNQYGTIQTTITVSGGKITEVAATYPTTPATTAQINARAIPTLRKEALAAQSATIDSVSGATYTTGSYKKSLQSAIDAAKA